MYPPRLFPIGIIIVLLLTLGHASATEQVIPQPLPPINPTGGVFTDPAWLSVDFHRVSVTIDDQVAQTRIDMQFTNHGDGLAEGTFVFPLPANAAADRLTMFIDGVPYNAKILSADEARQIYNEIVRQYRDPALLEYIGQQAIQASVFPIPAGESRRIQIDYSQLLPVVNGLVEYVYPMTGRRLVDLVSISVSVTSTTPLGTIYSPSHPIAISRPSDTAFSAGYEALNVVESQDFTLYYGLDTDTVNLNLLTYRESATGEDGYFLLLIQPPLTVADDSIAPQDVILVVDQSGSMIGQKWAQAQDAAAYVLANLNAEDRFNVIVFSTGYRVYAPGLRPAGEAGDAIAWVRSLSANGGTNINDALLAALHMVDARDERPAAVLFLTDGQATEGVIDTQAIIGNLNAARQPSTRIFTFGVGDDVNTTLLDTIARDFNGAGTYVRPAQNIETAVASLYNRISAPVLTNVSLSFDGIVAELMFPERLSDLFAGEQLTIAGRYRRGSGAASITLSGELRGERLTYRYDDLSFRETAGGSAFVARLWATRYIAELLNTIRLRGENAELVDSVVALSLRYGIITPYTSFLIEEDDILTQDGQRRARTAAREEFETMSDEVAGAGAVDRASRLNAMSQAAVPLMAATQTFDQSMGGMDRAETDGFAGGGNAQNPIQTVGDKTFIRLNGVWTDTQFQPDTMTPRAVIFLSDAYFALLTAQPELARYFALGEQVIVVLGGVAYQVTPAG